MTTNRKVAIKIYRGYGHKHNLVVYGHVFKGKPFPERRFTNNNLSNIFQLLRLFFVKPAKSVKLQLKWDDQVIETSSEEDGFFKLEWSSAEDVPAGWHGVQVDAVDEDGIITDTASGDLFVPHKTQYAFISDIDDTVMVSHSATIFKRLWTLFTRNPGNRQAFNDVVNHYQLLANAHTTVDVPNPFFYVSSSEWNLYDDLNAFFKINNLPKGVFLLNQLKQWNNLLKTGKTKHAGKLVRVYRIMEAFPLQKFVLIGDNSQADPVIYKTIAHKYPGKIFCVYIRNVVSNNAWETQKILDELNVAGVITCQFVTNGEAMEHSRKIGLVG